ncbi:MAG: hypothetical protein WBQ89_24735 [Candidatus Acidiferrum sp.]
MDLLRSATAFTSVAMTALLLGLLELRLAISGAEQRLFIFFLLALFRSPLWLTGFLANGKTVRTGAYR